MPTLRAIENSQFSPFDVLDDDRELEPTDNVVQHGSAVSSRSRTEQAPDNVEHGSQPDISHLPPNGATDWIEFVHRLVQTHGVTDFEEEGPVIYVQTWLVNHVR